MDVIFSRLKLTAKVKAKPADNRTFRWTSADKKRDFELETDAGGRQWMGYAGGEKWLGSFAPVIPGPPRARNPRSSSVFGRLCS